MAACSGPGDSTPVSKPTGVTMAADGSVVFFSTTSSHGDTIFKVTMGSDAASSTIALLAGKPNTAGATDGIGTNARFNDPADLATNSAGTLVFVANTYGNAIQRIDVATGAVVTMASLGTNVRPSTISVTQDGNDLYFFADLFYQSTTDLWKIASAATCTSCSPTKLYDGILRQSAGAPHTGKMSLTKDGQHAIVTVISR